MGIKYDSEETEFDSVEELMFSFWVEELKDAGVITSAIFHPDSFPLTDKHTALYTKRTELKTKVKEEIKELIIARPMVYTPDWLIKFHPHFQMKLAFKGLVADARTGVSTSSNPTFIFSNNLWYVDVKGVATKFDDGRYFTAMQKMTLQKHGVYTQRLEISNKLSSFFTATFTPKNFLTTEKTKQARTLKYEPVSCLEWIGSL